MKHQSKDFMPELPMAVERIGASLRLRSQTPRSGSTFSRSGSALRRSTRWTYASGSSSLGSRVT